VNKVVIRCIFIVSVGAYIIVSLCAPWVLSDHNIFLKEFVNHEFLNLLGIIVAITLASAANLHLEFNKIEDTVGRAFLSRTRNSVKRSVSWLIGGFSFGFLLVVAKPLLPPVETSTALINGIAVLIVIFNILILIDLTQLVFKIRPMFEIVKEDGIEDESSESKRGEGEGKD